MEAAGTKVKGQLGWLEVSRAKTRGIQRPRTGCGTPGRGRWALSALLGHWFQKLLLRTQERFSTETDVRGEKENSWASPLRRERKLSKM